MDYMAVTSLQDALGALKARAPRIIAGGTDVYPAQGDRAFREPLLDISRIAALRGIAATADGGWRIGASTTWSDIVRADLPAAFDGLKAAAREVGALQIQNAGTIAGNICNASPAADGVPPLLCLDARVEIASASGTRELPLRDFILGPRKTALTPGEMVTALHVPAQGALARGAFQKLGARKYLVISIAMVCAVVEVSEGAIASARVAVGACSPVAQRLPDLERALTGCALADVRDMVRPDHLRGLAPIDDVRGSGAYRMDVVRELVARVIVEAAHG